MSPPLQTSRQTLETPTRRPCQSHGPNCYIPRPSPRCGDGHDQPLGITSSGQFGTTSPCSFKTTPPMRRRRGLLASKAAAAATPAGRTREEVIIRRPSAERNRVRPGRARTRPRRGSSLRMEPREDRPCAQRNATHPSALPLATWEEATSRKTIRNGKGGEREARHRPTAEQGSKGRPGRNNATQPTTTLPVEFDPRNLGSDRQDATGGVTAPENGRVGLQTYPRFRLIGGRGRLLVMLRSESRRAEKRARRRHLPLHPGASCSPGNSPPKSACEAHIPLNLFWHEFKDEPSGPTLRLTGMPKT